MQVCVHICVYVCVYVYVYWMYVYGHVCMCWVCVNLYPSNHQEFSSLLFVPECQRLSRGTIKHYNWDVVATFDSNFSLWIWKVGSDQPNDRSVISSTDFFFLKLLPTLIFLPPGLTASALHSLLSWVKKCYVYNYSHKIKMCVIIYAPPLTSLLSCSVWLFDDFPVSSLLTLCTLLSSESPAHSSFL